MTKKNYIYAITTVLIWSTLAAVAKMLLTDIPNMQTISISSFLASLFLFLMNIKTGAIKELRGYSFKDICIVVGLGFLGFFVYSAMYYYGLSQLTSQEACILNYLWPVMIVVFACVILKEKMTITKAFALICSFAGIVVLSSGGGEVAGGNRLIGMGACILAAVSYGLFSVLNKKTKYNPNVSMMIMWFVAGVSSLVLGLFTENWILIQGTQWIGMLWLGVVVNAVAYLLWAKALNGAENTAQVANFAFLTPFLSLVVSAALLGEKIQVRAALALILIIGGILIQTYSDDRRKKER